MIHPFIFTGEQLAGPLEDARCAWIVVRTDGRKGLCGLAYAAVEHYHAPGRVGRARGKPKLGNALRFAVLKRDGYRCQLCGRTAADGVQLDVDHKIPRARGGSNSMDNLWVLCSPCNHGKGIEDL